MEQLNPQSLENLTPLVAVCVVFAGCLCILMRAFLSHLDTKDRRIAAVVSETQNVLLRIQNELTALAENSRQQSAILSRLTFKINRHKSARKEEPKVTS